MLILAISAAFVGLAHSLAPGHWLPVVLLAKGRKWPLKTALLGALAAASGHIVISAGVGILSVVMGSQFLPDLKEDVERYTGLILGAFGLGFAIYSYFRHSSCHGHTHHGPTPDNTRGAFFFLFSLGFSPCLSVLPVIATAGALGSMATALAVASFSVGVIITLSLTTLVASLGLMKLDHPLFEHYGDVIAGLGLALMGVIFFFFPM